MVRARRRQPGIIYVGRGGTTRFFEWHRQRVRGPATGDSPSFLCIGFTYHYTSVLNDYSRGTI